MTTVKEPVKTYTNVPKPIKAPVFGPPVKVGVPEKERELVPVGKPGQADRS